MKNLKRQTAVLSILVIVVLTLTNSFLRISHPPKNNISWDTFGYYLYLPTTFIYGDPGLEDKAIIDELIEKYHSTGTFYQVSLGPKGHWLMKYSMGMAVFYSPAFFTGHFVAINSDYPADGFSKPYQWALVWNGILIFLIGMIFLRKVLLRFFEDKIVAIILLLLYLGTNYFSYSTFNAEMPHTYLFTTYAAVLLFTIKWHDRFQLKYAILLSITIGLSTLARPTELIALILPVFWNVWSYTDLKNKLKSIWKSYKGQLIIFVSILLVIGSFQIIYWKIYSGDFIYYSYANPGEGFEFLWPYTLKFLFSFRKGWFIYTPIMLLSIWGMFLLYKRNRIIFVPIFLFFIVNLYIVSSWSCWWYAQSFGQRAMVQSYAVLSIPMGYALLRIGEFSIRKRWIFYVVILLLVGLNLFQYWQLRKNILSGDRMTFSYYVNSFGATKANPEDQKLLLINRFNLISETIPSDSSLNRKVLKTFHFEPGEENTDKHLSNSNSRSGEYSLKMDSTFRFGPTFKETFNNLTDNYYAWIRVSVWVYPIHDISSTPTSLIVSFQHKGKNYKYRGLDLNSKDVINTLKLNQWNKISMDYLTPEVRSGNDNLVVYLWNRGDLDIYFDDLTIECYTESLD